jgi:hydrogenase maturation factor
MKAIVTKYVNGCVMCSTSKLTNRKLGLYSPLPIPSHPCKSISMDFVGDLLMSKGGHDYLYVVVDKYNKMCILIPCKKQIIVEQTANLFFQYVSIHFGLPTSIISDQDTRFLVDFWEILWRMMNTKLKRSIAFHPQTDGDTEVVNRTMVIFLRGYYNKHPM